MYLVTGPEQSHHKVQTYFFTWPPMDTRADSMFRICPLFTLMGEGQDQRTHDLEYALLVKHLLSIFTLVCMDSISPPLNGILHRLKGLWSTPEEILHTV